MTSARSSGLRSGAAGQTTLSWQLAGAASPGQLAAVALAEAGHGPAQRRALEERDDELAAVRETNRRLMNQINRPGQ